VPCSATTGQLRLYHQRKNEVERRAIKIGTVEDAGVTIAEGISRQRSGRAVGRSVP
jgi:hypothetical protein